MRNALFRRTPSRAFPVRALFALTLLAGAVQVQAATDWSGTWSSLWRNADQRGQALLQRGDAAAAARQFADPRRKSYAEFKAGDYAAAARELSPFDDSDAHYNRGNALAHAGDLQGALKAYDAALKRDPNNRDARHNRDLVTKALKQQQQQKDAGKNAPKSGKQDEKKESKQDNKLGSNQQDNKQGNKQNNKQPDRNQQGGSTQSASGADKPEQKGQAENPHAHQSAQNEASQPQPGKDKAAGQQDAQAKQDEKQDQKRSDAEQARRDVDAGMKEAARDHTPGPATDATSVKQAAAPTEPLSEKQISQEQWLRSIPDDPGGLLRRKFLIEHMLRQQHAQQ